MLGLGLGGGVLAIAALGIMILVLVWLAERVLHFIGLRTGWRPLDPRNLGASIVALTAAIHLGNFAVDWIEASLRGGYGPGLGFPSSILIGAVSIGVGIAAIRWHRRQKQR